MSTATALPTSTIERVEMPRQPYVAVRATMPLAEISARMGGLFEELFGWLAEHQVPPVGEPWTRYLAVGTEEVELELGVPVAAPVAVLGDVISGVRPAGAAYRALHIGPYDRLTEAYDALQRELAANNLATTGAMWEVYESDPSFEPNAEKWRTWVYYPV